MRYVLCLAALSLALVSDVRAAEPQPRKVEWVADTGGRTSEDGRLFTVTWSADATAKSNAAILPALVESSAAYDLKGDIIVKTDGKKTNVTLPYRKAGAASIKSLEFQNQAAGLVHVKVTTVGSLDPEVVKKAAGEFARLYYPAFPLKGTEIIKSPKDGELVVEATFDAKYIK
jgi:hypothetical protein